MIPARGLWFARRTSASSHPSWGTVSLFRNTRSSPSSAAAAPRFTDPANPRFSVLRTTVIISPWRSSTSVVSSLEASSTTMIVASSFCSRSADRH